MRLSAGSLIGRYEILSPLGAGGMGEVYRARDTRLDRTVAIKVLPPHLAGDEQWRRRFEREARAVSSLSHPHICSLYDVGRQDEVDFIVMEHLEGETLAARLARGPLPLDKLLRAGAEIADALDRAHRRGVVHRDLKPANVMLTKAGTKLLDFGLARLRAEAGSTPAPGAGDLTALTTRARQEPLTHDGAIPGTLPYMAPEQLEGSDADARTDLFAFGAVLYEMATGRRAFEGTSRASLIAAILEREPTPVSALQSAAPAALERLIGRCLAKDPEDRWQTARDVVLELRSIAEEGRRPDSAPLPTGRGKLLERLGWLAGTGFLALGLAWLAFGPPGRRQAETRALRLSLLPPAPGSTISDLAVSPDGRNLALVLRAAGGTSLWVRPLDSLSGRPLPGTEGALDPFWSPDGRFVGFFAGGKLLKVAAEGGPPQVLCAAPFGHGGSWSSDGTIVFGQLTGGLRRVSPAGGEPEPVPTALPDSRQGTQMLPHFVPGGRRFLFLQWTAEEGSAIMAGSLDSSLSTRLLAIRSEAAYSPPGYLLYVRGGTLVAQPFDAERSLLSGEAVQVAERVADADFGNFVFSVSPTGALAYASESPTSRLVWYDRTGRELGQVGEPGDYLHVDLSPDGARLAVERGDPLGPEHDVWIVDPARGVSSRLTFDPGFDAYPIWSPDGTQVVFASVRDGAFGLYRKPWSGLGREERLLAAPDEAWPTSFSPDGRLLVFESPWGEPAPPDLWLLPQGGGREPARFEKNATWENKGMVSPDGRWIAYNSDQGLYVQSFPTPGAKWQISARGGSARWRRDGKELFFVSDSGELMAIEVRADTAFHPGAPRRLFQLPSPRVYKNREFYAVTADGGRFLVNRREEASSPVTVVVNWTAGLRP